MTQQAPRNVRSMTGQGHASDSSELGIASIEIRTVNSRGFKCVQRLGESLVTFESRIEALVRSRVHRGTIHLNASLKRPSVEEIPSVNTEAIKAYLETFRTIGPEHQDILGPIDYGLLLSLPGVLNTKKLERTDDDLIWSFLENAISQAIENLNDMRLAEGERMAESLDQDCHQVECLLKEINVITPRSVEVYRQRLQGKIERTLEEQGLQVSSIDLLREVQIYADRVDIQEEVVRLDSHLKMFGAALQGSDEQKKSKGRKLDFILQEMFREINTIGSKASDSEISARVVDIKCAVERMRELVQNIE